MVVLGQPRVAPRVADGQSHHVLVQTAAVALLELLYLQLVVQLRLLHLLYFELSFSGLLRLLQPKLELHAAHLLVGQPLG